MNTHTRADVKTGDMLVWSSPSGSDGGFWLKIVRFLTVSDYGHVSVAWRQGKELFHVEAVIPKIRVVRVPDNAEFYVLPMVEVVKGSENMEFFNDKIGSEYSVYDAIRAYLGISTRYDERWQCAELTEAYYRDKGLDIDLKFLTPTRLVKKLMSKVNSGLYRVNKPSPK